MSTAAIDLTDLTLPLVPVDIETRPTFLMCEPRLYEVDYVINPWMAGNVHAASRERATQQWQALHQAVSEIADVVLVDPQPGSPDMVFTANAGLIHGDEVAISSFFPRETPFEGEGDALFSEDGSRLWAGYGPRTLETSHYVLRNAWGIDVVGLELIDPRFYHLDTCFAPLFGGFVMYFAPAFSASSLARIEAFYPVEKRILVEESDAVCFACNAVNIGNTMILNRIGTKLSKQLQLLGFDVIQIELSEFMRAGGAAKCLVMKLPGF
jgi:ornithine--oxo-acid transaminase